MVPEENLFNQNMDSLNDLDTSISNSRQTPLFNDLTEFKKQESETKPIEKYIRLKLFLFSFISVISLFFSFYFFININKQESYVIYLSYSIIFILGSIFSFILVIHYIKKNNSQNKNVLENKETLSKENNN